METLFDVVLIDNQIRVLIDPATGEPAAVQCAVSGAPAEFFFSRKQISDALTIARNAWQATADCYI
jgi:hypothetical protein